MVRNNGIGLLVMEHSGLMSSGGFGDNPNGTNGDQFLNDSLRWSRDGDDIDQEGDDDFINDPTQHLDLMVTDMETTVTEQPDAMNDSSEWKDSDGDGGGDNSDDFRFESGGRTMMVMETVTMLTVQEQTCSLTIQLNGLTRW